MPGQMYDVLIHGRVVECVQLLEGRVIRLQGRRDVGTWEKVERYRHRKARRVHGPKHWQDGPAI